MDLMGLLKIKWDNAIKVVIAGPVQNEFPINSSQWSNLFTLQIRKLSLRRESDLPEITQAKLQSWHSISIFKKIRGIYFQQTNFVSLKLYYSFMSVYRNLCQEETWQILFSSLLVYLFYHLAFRKQWFSSLIIVIECLPCDKHCVGTGDIAVMQGRWASVMSVPVGVSLGRCESLEAWRGPGPGIQGQGVGEPEKVCGQGPGCPLHKTE